MKIDRTVFVNPVEPEYLAFRFSSGIDTKIDFHFKDQAGAPYNEDVVAQLQMTSRSRDVTEYYSVPAIDVVNGIARVSIPGDIAYDPNGWRLRLTGTISQEPRVLAYGTATAVAGAGPQEEVQDVIDAIDINMVYGSDCIMIVKVWEDDGSVPFDLTTSVVAASIYDVHGGNILQSFTVTPVDVNIVQLTMAAALVDTLPAKCWWDLTIAYGGGVTTITEGNVSLGAPP